MKMQIDDFECDTCDKLTIAEADTKAGTYICFGCGENF